MMRQFRPAGIPTYWRRAILVGAVVGICGALAYLSPWGGRLEKEAGLAWLYAVRGPLAPPADVVIVMMNRRSADALGLSSDLREWPRHLHARLVDKLVEKGAAVVVFDVFFKGSRGSPEDIALAEAIRRSGRTVLFQRMEQDRVSGQAATTQQLVANFLISPAPDISRWAGGLGPFPLPKVPARVDQFWAFTADAGQLPTLPVVALHLSALGSRESQSLARLGSSEADAYLAAYRRSAMGPADLHQLMLQLRTHFQRERPQPAGAAVAPASEVTIPPGAQEERHLRALIDTYRGPESYFINYYGPAGTIRTVPYHEALHDAATAGSGQDADFRGKVVFIGALELDSATMTDGFYTVYSRRDGVDLSGAEIAATAFANLLDGSFIRHPKAVHAVAAVFVFGWLAAMLALLRSGIGIVFAALALGAFYFAITGYAFAAGHLWLPLAVPVLIQLPAAILLAMLAQYGWVRRISENLVHALPSFLPEAVVGRLASGAGPQVSTELVYGVCLFVDIEGYSGLSERLPVHALAGPTIRYYDLVGRAVEGHHGTVLRYSGDGVVGVWDARHFTDIRQMRHDACHAALDIRDAMDRFDHSDGMPRLPTRLGLHEDEFVQGILGGGGHYEFSALGDTLNTASRIETLNKHVGTRVLASGTAVRGVDNLLVRRIGRFRLMGKSDALDVYEIVERAGRATPRQIELCVRYTELRDLFEARRWEEAAEQAADLIARYPEDGPARFLRLEIERHRNLATADRVPVIVMDRK